MAQETPSANPYWETLSPEDLVKYDKALKFVYAYIGYNRDMEYASKVGQIILTSQAKEAVLSIDSWMPPIWAFYDPPGIPPEEE